MQRDMVKPEVVVFDLGNVLVDFDYAIAARRIATRSTKASAEEVNRLINQSPLLHRFEHGDMTTEEFFAEVKATIGFEGDLEEFAPLFGDIFSEIPEMTKLNAALRKNSVPTCIFSNTNALAVAHITRAFPFYANFNDYIYSYEIGAMKPETKAYEAVECAAKCRGGRILYIDDRAENVNGGAARGWQVVLHENSEKTLAAVKKLGFPTQP